MIKNNYSFLKDEMALMEIRKHKWIESEKCGQEIGFATAAMDWIKKHGMNWQRTRIFPENIDLTFLERRNHRRYSHHVPVYIKTKKQWIKSTISNLNLVGFVCSSPIPFFANQPIEIMIKFKKFLFVGSKFHLTTRVQRLQPVAAVEKKPRYNIFVPFDESVRDYLRFHPEILTNPL